MMSSDEQLMHSKSSTSRIDTSQVRIQAIKARKESSKEIKVRINNIQFPQKEIKKVRTQIQSTMQDTAQISTHILQNDKPLASESQNQNKQRIIEPLRKELMPQKGKEFTPILLKKNEKLKLNHDPSIQQFFENKRQNAPQFNISSLGSMERDRQKSSFLKDEEKGRLLSIEEQMNLIEQKQQSLIKRLKTRLVGNHEGFVRQSASTIAKDQLKERNKKIKVNLKLLRQSVNNTSMENNQKEEHLPLIYLKSMISRNDLNKSYENNSQDYQDYERGGSLMKSEKSFTDMLPQQRYNDEPECIGGHSLKKDLQIVGDQLRIQNQKEAYYVKTQEQRYAEFEPNFNDNKIWNSQERKIPARYKNKNLHLSQQQSYDYNIAPKTSKKNYSLHLGPPKQSPSKNFGKEFSIKFPTELVDDKEMYFPTIEGKKIEPVETEPDVRSQEGGQYQNINNTQFAINVSKMRVSRQSNLQKLKTTNPKTEVKQYHNFSYLDDALIEQDINNVNQIFGDKSDEKLKFLEKHSHSVQDMSQEQLIIPYQNQNMEYSDEKQIDVYQNNFTPRRRIKIKKDLNSFFSENFQSIESKNQDIKLKKLVSKSQINKQKNKQSATKQKLAESILKGVLQKNGYNQKEFEQLDTTCFNFNNISGW